MKIQVSTGNNNTQTSTDENTTQIQFGKTVLFLVSVALTIGAGATLGFAASILLLTWSPMGLLLTSLVAFLHLIMVSASIVTIYLVPYHWVAWYRLIRGI